MFDLSTSSTRPAKIRIATLADAPRIADLSGQLGYPTSASESERRLAALLGAPGHAVFVACLDADVIGWIHVFLALRVASDPFAELGGFVVEESRRRNGFGRRLFDAAEEWARSRSVFKIRVRLRSERDGARAFYEASGFSYQKGQNVFDKALFEDPDGRTENG